MVSVLVHDNMSLAAQLPPISWVFPYFFPPFREPRPYGCPESATAKLSPSARHTRAGSVPTFFGIPLAWSSAGNTDASCYPHSIPAEASSTDNPYVKPENPIQDFARVCGGPPSWLLSSLGIGNVPFDLFPELIGNVSPTRPTRKRRSILLPSHCGSPPTRRTLATNLQKV